MSGLTSSLNEFGVSHDNVAVETGKVEQEVWDSGYESCDTKGETGVSHGLRDELKPVNTTRSFGQRDRNEKGEKESFRVVS